MIITPSEKTTYDTINDNYVKIFNKTNHQTCVQNLTMLSIKNIEEVYIVGHN